MTASNLGEQLTTGSGLPHIGFQPSRQAPSQTGPEYEQVESHASTQPLGLSTSLWLNDGGTMTTQPPPLITSGRTDKHHIKLTPTVSYIHVTATLTSSSEEQTLAAVSTGRGFERKKGGMTITLSDPPQQLPGKPEDVTMVPARGVDWTSTTMTSVLVVSAAATFILCVFIGAAVMKFYKWVLKKHKLLIINHVMDVIAITSGDLLFDLNNFSTSK